MKKAGFTLIEMLIVIVVIGVLGAIFAPNISNSSNNAKTVKLIEGAGSVASTWMLLTNVCGLSTAVASNPVALAGKEVDDVLFNGVANVDTPFQACYRNSKIVPLVEMFEPAAVAGSYAISGFTVTLAGGGTVPMTIALAGVPEDLVLAIAQKYNPQLATLAASDTTSPAFQYSVASGGTRTATFVKVVN